MSVSAYLTGCCCHGKWAERCTWFCRLTEGMARMEEPLVKMKFVCKEFWTALLGHHAGGLKTNHKVNGFIR